LLEKTVVCRNVTKRLGLLFLVNVISLLFSTSVYSEDLIAPSISAPTSSSSGSYNVTFNAPATLLDTQDVRLYESYNEAGWYYISGLSNGSGYTPNATISFSNKSNGSYSYKAAVCQIDTTSCSPYSNDSTVTVKRPTWEPTYGLALSGDGDYVDLSEDRIYLGQRDWELEFEWTYGGKGNCSVMSGGSCIDIQRGQFRFVWQPTSYKNSTTWPLTNTSGAHIYRLVSSYRKLTLYVDGVSQGYKWLSISGSVPSLNVEYIGRGNGWNNFASGTMHWLKVTDIDRPERNRYFQFEDNSDVIVDEEGVGNGILRGGSWVVDNTPESPPATPAKPTIFSSSSYSDSYEIVFTPGILPNDHEYRLYESYDGEEWNFISALNSVLGDVAPLTKNINKFTDQAYKYKASRCVKGTSICSSYSNVTSVSANVLLSAPTISAPELSDVSGSYAVDFNTPIDVPDNHEYRLYESKSEGVDWKLITSMSQAAGDQLPFTHSVSNKLNGAYQYRSEICLGEVCSPDSNTLIVAVSRLPVIIDNYALEFDGVDDYLDFGMYNRISLGNYGELEFKWTYQGPGDNYVLSQFRPDSGSLSSSFLYITENGLGASIKGVRKQWEFDATGTHTYFLRGNPALGGWELFVDGVSQEVKEYSEIPQLDVFQTMGARPGNQFSRGKIHWLKTNSKGRYNYPFEDNSDQIRDSIDSKVILFSHGGTWQHSEDSDLAFLYPPSFIYGRLALRNTLSDSSHRINYSIPLKIFWDAPENYEYRLFESSNRGASWSSVGAMVPEPYLRFSFVDKTEREYHYQAKVCLQGSMHCSELSRHNMVVANLSYLTPRVPQPYTPMQYEFTSTTPCFRWEDLGSNIVYSLSVIEGPTWDRWHTIEQVKTNEACWGGGWKTYRRSVDGNNTISEVRTAPPLTLPEGAGYAWHVVAHNTSTGYSSNDHSEQRYFYVDTILKPPAIGLVKTDGSNSFEVNITTPWSEPGNLGYRLYERVGFDGKWRMIKVFSKWYEDSWPFKRIEKDKEEALYFYKAEVCMGNLSSAANIVCSDYSNIVLANLSSISFLEGEQPPTLSATSTSSTGNYNINFNALESVPNNYEYRLYESINEGQDWEYIGYISKAMGGMRPLRSVEEGKANGQYQYKANICAKSAEITSCTGYSDVITVSVENASTVEETSMHTTKRLGSLLRANENHPGTYAFVEFVEMLSVSCRENRVFLQLNTDFGEAAFTEIKAAKALGKGHSYVAYDLLSDGFCELTNIRIQ